MSGPNAQKSGLSLTLNQRRRIRHLLKTAKKDPRHTQMSLQSYLLMPIQRIPRYKLLLEALLECTPMADMPDQGEPAIASALESISNLATEMNERKRDNEGRQRLVSWLTAFPAVLLDLQGSSAILASPAIAIQGTFGTASPDCAERRTHGGSSY